MLHEPPQMTRAERTSVFLSAGAFALSACALVISLRGSSAPGPASLLTASPPQFQREAPAAVSVQLEQLMIDHSNLMSDAVGTSQLQDASVTTAKLADGAVSTSKLGGDTLAAIAMSVARADKLVGEVDGSGEVIRGSGFKVTLKGPGDYTLSFTEPFLTPPVVVAVAQEYAVCYLPIQTLGLSEVTIKCMSDLLGSAPVAVNTRFSFYAAPAV